MYSITSVQNVTSIHWVLENAAAISATLSDGSLVNLDMNSCLRGQFKGWLASYFVANLETASTKRID